MSEATWVLIAVVAASTLIGTALVIADRARQRTGTGPGMHVAGANEPICEATDGIWTCTRPPHRTGDHAGHGESDTVPVHTWPREDQAAAVTPGPLRRLKARFIEHNDRLIQDMAREQAERAELKRITRRTAA